MEIEDMLSAFLNKDSPSPEWCVVREFEVINDQVRIHYDFPCISGRKSSECVATLLEIMTWVWSCTCQPTP